MRSIDCVRDRFGVVEEPVQAVERNVLVDPLEDVERAADRLVIGRVHAPGPAVLRQDPHHFLQLALHLRGHVGTRLAEVLEVGGREHQHLAGAVVAEVVVALLVASSAVQFRKSSFSCLAFCVNRL